MPCRELAASRPAPECFVLDLVYLLATAALFALVGFVARGVQRL